MSTPNPRRSISLRRLKTGVIAIATALPLTILGIPAASAASNSHEMAPNEHTHVNWLFTKAGNYQATFAITVPYQNPTGKTSSSVTTEATLNFQVGAEGTVSSGHYDFGPHLEGDNQVSAKVKNPSGQWQDPGEIWFGLTEAAHRDLPAEICTGLNLSAGCAGWVIPQSQESAIPWLGFNTQDDGVAKLLQGKATFTLTSLSGPGDLHVWQSGFDTAISQVWFAAGGNSTGAFEPSATDSDTPDRDTKDAKLPAGAKAPREKENTPTTSPTPTPNTPGKTPEGGQKPSPQPDPTKTTAPPETAGIPAAIGSQPPAGNHPGSEPCYPIPSSQKFTLPLQTHVHPNWIFTQPGNYQVGIRQNARINGTWQSADTILNFTVGGAGNANEGHFDLGAKVENGRLVAALKDDRTPGGTWVDPRSLAFGLGTGSQAKLPAGLEFLAPAGTPVWMIGSTQTSGVPWLGANTQHPSLLQATNEPVSWEMISFRGPNPQARLAVFTSGNFGKIVGQKWFTAPTSAANVGRTASGKYCRLGVGSQAQNANISRVTGGLAATGIGNLTLALAVLAGGIILLGLGMFFQAADRKNAVAD